MESIWQLWMAIVRSIPVLVTDSRYMIVILLVLLLVYNQYRRVHSNEQAMFNLHRGSPLIDTLKAFGYGLLGGFLGTAFFMLLGLSITDMGIFYLWIVALLLLLIHPRFLCFSYAGGIISMLHLLTGYPPLDIPSLMALVAVLHLIESFLIWVNGHEKATPVYLKHSSGKVVGGFAMHRFWPLPFVALLAMAMLRQNVDFQTMAMPDWWPLIQPQVRLGPEQTLVYMMFPVIAALGYTDLAVTSLPRQKTRLSARYLLLFSLILLALALLANYVPALVFLPILFSPLGHEWVIHQGQRQEWRSPPVFTAKEGIMVLDVYPGSPAEQMGLGPGDVIKSVNGIPLTSPQQLVAEMTPWLVDPVFQVENHVEQTPPRSVPYRGKIPPIGIIPVPEENQRAYIEIRQGFLISWWKRLVRRIKKRRT